MHANQFSPGTAIPKLRQHPFAILLLGAGGGLVLAIAATMPAATQSSAAIAEAGANPDIARLEAYIRRLPDKNPQSHPRPVAEAEAALPDVATMMVRLETRLAADPSDAEGWRLLALSHQHLGNLSGAAQAIEQAIALRPDDSELTAALAEVRRRASARP